MTTTTFERGRLDAASHDALMKLFPILEAPPGALPDAEELAAYAEGLLLPDEASRLLDFIRRSPAARAEFRALYPSHFAEVFSPSEVALIPRDNVIRPNRWRRPLAIAVGSLAAAAAALFLLAPTSPPEGAELSIAPLAKTRSAPQTAMPQEQFQLLIRLGSASVFDQMRGNAPFGLLYMVDSGGHASLVCTSDDPDCRSSETTMSYLYQAPIQPGEQHLVFVSGVGSINLEAARSLESTAVDWSSFERDLADTASGQGWRVHPPRVLLVK